MKKLTKLLLLLTFTTASLSEAADPIAKIGWKKLRDLENPKKVIQNTGSQKPIALLTVESPKITQQNHAVGGETRYADVAGDGFAEMWTHYENGAHYFSRTLGSAGPMAKLSGNSEWRPFLLPFFGDGKALPSKLQVNLMLPGGGTVEFRNVALYQLPDDRTGAAEVGWWSEGTGAKIGGIGGSALGLLGAICGIFASTGRARWFCIGLCKVFIVVGCLGVILGFSALIASQPYAVWFPALLIGGILLLLGGLLHPVLRRVYLNHELRTISAAG